MKFEIQGFGKISEWVNEFKPEPKDINLLLRTLADTAIVQTEMHFIAESGPAGKWKVSQRVQAKGGKTLNDTGSLKASIEKVVSGKGAYIGSNKEYANIHQFGGTIRQTTKKGNVRSIVMPARPYLYIGEKEGNQIATITAGFIARKWRR